QTSFNSWPKQPGSFAQISLLFTGRTSDQEDKNPGDQWKNIFHFQRFHTLSINIHNHRFLKYPYYHSQQSYVKEEYNVQVVLRNHLYNLSSFSIYSRQGPKLYCYKDSLAS